MGALEYMRDYYAHHTYSEGAHNRLTADDNLISTILSSAEPFQFFYAAGEMVSFREISEITFTIFSTTSLLNAVGIRLSCVGVME